MSHNDPTRAIDVDKRTPSPNKHSGRKVVIICASLVAAVGAMIFWATSSEDKPTTDPTGLPTYGSTTSSPSPAQTLDGRYTKYIGNFPPNVQVTLKCTNGKPSNSVSWLPIPGGSSSKDIKLKLADIVDVTAINTDTGCSWQFSTPSEAWYKVVVPYEDTKKGYWKIHQQDRHPGNGLHQVTTGANGQAIVLLYDNRVYPGERVMQFNDSQYDAPGTGAPDTLKLPKLPSNGSPSPTATP